jgi:hypothetical protein
VLDHLPAAAFAAEPPGEPAARALLGWAAEAADAGLARVVVLPAPPAAAGPAAPGWPEWRGDGGGVELCERAELLWLGDLAPAEAELLAATLAASREPPDSVRRIIQRREPRDGRAGDGDEGAGGERDGGWWAPALPLAAGRPAVLCELVTPPYTAFWNELNVGMERDAAGDGDSEAAAQLAGAPPEGPWGRAEEAEAGRLLAGVLRLAPAMVAANFRPDLGGGDAVVADAAEAAAAAEAAVGAESYRAAAVWALLLKLVGRGEGDDVQVGGSALEQLRRMGGGRRCLPLGEALALLTADISTEAALRHAVCLPPTPEQLAAALQELRALVGTVLEPGRPQDWEAAVEVAGSNPAAAGCPCAALFDRAGAAELCLSGVAAAAVRRLADQQQAAVDHEVAPRVPGGGRWRWELALLAALRRRQLLAADEWRLEVDRQAADEARDYAAALEQALGEELREREMPERARASAVLDAHLAVEQATGRARRSGAELGTRGRQLAGEAAECAARERRLQLAGAAQYQ